MEKHCKGCQKLETEDFEIETRYDYYGIFTGDYCDECYENNYPYKKNAYYDYFEAGEYLDDDNN